MVPGHRVFIILIGEVRFSLGATRFYLLLGSVFKAEFGIHSLKLPGHDLRVLEPLPLVVTMTSPTLE